MPADNMRDRILDAAEARARRGGYHGFSFRDVAADVGVKSASIHYHFPTKADLAAALAERYAARAGEALGDPGGAADAVAKITTLFRNALMEDDKMCLCGVFAAERDALPADVAAATRRFFDRLLGVLARAYEQDGLDHRADAPSPALIVSGLEGALLTARATGDASLFAAVAAELSDAVSRAAEPRRR